MKMNQFVIMGSLMVTTAAQASVKIECDDDVSGQITVVTLNQRLPLKASVLTRNQDNIESYFQARSVRVTLDTDGYVVDFGNNSLEIPHIVLIQGYGMGVYQDGYLGGGDSRAVECEVVR